MVGLHRRRRVGRRERGGDATHPEEVVPMSIADDLRAAATRWHTDTGLLEEAADELDRLEALVERDRNLIGRMERTMLHDQHIGDDDTPTAP